MVAGVGWDDRLRIQRLRRISKALVCADVVVASECAARDCLAVVLAGGEEDMKPHLICVVDFNWFGVRAGMGFYDLCADEFRPAFVDLWAWKWRMTFEFGRIHRRFL